MPTHRDDMGRTVVLARSPARLVSLVPSLSEALAVTVPDLLVGVTDYCTHTADVEPARVRGTKNPDHAAIARLHPDLVVANREENRRVDVERLEESGVPVWVTEIESLEQAFRSLRRLFAALGAGEPTWLADARHQWSRGAELPGVPTLVPVWRDPWMAVGRGTFAGDLLRRLGLRNVLDGVAERYPRRTLTELVGLRPALVLLPDEPYAFTGTDGPEAFPDTRTALVPGRALTWYGPSLVTARRVLTDSITGALGTRRDA